MTLRTASIPKGTPNARVGADVLLAQIRQTALGPIVDDHHLLPAYVASVCAAIEFRLNEAYIAHFHKKLGFSYTTYVAPYLRLGIEDKFGMLIPLISDFRFEVERTTARYKMLMKLFRLRNRLIHQVPHLVEAKWEELDGAYRIYYLENEFRYAHSHQEWTSIRRRDLVAIHAALNFWMVWLYDIGIRIQRRKFNHKGVTKRVGA